MEEREREAREGSCLEHLWGRCNEDGRVLWMGLSGRMLVMEGMG